MPNAMCFPSSCKVTSVLNTDAEYKILQFFISVYYLMGLLSFSVQVYLVRLWLYVALVSTYGSGGWKGI